MKYAKEFGYAGHTLPILINGTLQLNDFLNHAEVRHQIQFRNIDDLRIPLHTEHNFNSLFAVEPSIRGMAYQVSCAAHHRSVLSRINYDSCIRLSHSL